MAVEREDQLSGLPDPPFSGERVETREASPWLRGTGMGTLTKWKCRGRAALPRKNCTAAEELLWWKKSCRGRTVLYCRNYCGEGILQCFQRVTSRDEPKGPLKPMFNVRHKKGTFLEET